MAWAPPQRPPTLVADFARRLAGQLGLPAHEAVAVAAETPSQRSRNNSVQQAANALDGYAVTGTVPDGPVLLAFYVFDFGSI